MLHDDEYNQKHIVQENVPPSFVLSFYVFLVEKKIVLAGGGLTANGNPEGGRGKKCCRPQKHRYFSRTAL